MWDAANVALLKTLGQWPQCRADRNLIRSQPRRRVRQVAVLSASRQAQDRVDPEAKTGAVGSLHLPGR
jgi:hypothetical protein